MYVSCGYWIEQSIAKTALVLVTKAVSFSTANADSIKSPETVVTRVAAQVGFTSVRPLAKLVHATTGVHMRSLRETTNFNRLVPPILDYLGVPPLD